MGKILTVSIAAYNVQETIERALDSLLDPRINDVLEIFVVDDGGKDETLTIAKRYAEKYPNTVFPIHKENGGYGSTINASLERATGKYFKQLDGDDWFLKENFVEFMEVLKKTEANCVISEVADYYAGSGKQEINEAHKNITEGLHTFADTEFNSVITMHGTAIKAEILQKNKIHIIEKCFYSDTELVVLPMPYLNSFYMFKKAVYVYFIGAEGQSMSLGGIEKHYPDHEKVYWELVDAYNKIPKDEVNKRKLVLMRLAKEAVFQFEFLCCLPVNREHKKELMQFGMKLKREYPEIYEATRNRRRMTRILWDTYFLMYPLIAKRTRQKYQNR